MSRPFVFVDVETTGLDPSRHEIWEMAYALDDEGPVRSSTVDHIGDHASPTALHVGRYMQRQGASSRWTTNNIEEFDIEMAVALSGATLVAANPSFDTAFLKARWGEAPWHYRTVDIETYAMAVLCLDEPPGMATIVKILREQEFDIPKPDHTAGGDVEALRASFRALRAINVSEGSQP